MFEVRSARKEELVECLAIRRQVFIDEQGVTEEEEIDGLDETSQQFIALVDGAPAGTARLRGCKAERLAVLKRYRGMGLGDLIMDVVEATAHDQGHEELVLNAQAQIIPFYQKRRYVAHGEPFLDARIEHRSMRLFL